MSISRHNLSAALTWIFLLLAAKFAPAKPCAPAHNVYGLIGVRWNQLGASDGPLGCPTSDEHDHSEGKGRYQTFEHGAIGWSPNTGDKDVQSAYLLGNQIRVQWGDTAPFGYDKFIVRWDKDGRNLGQQDVGGSRSSGNFSIAAQGYGTYRIVIEGCDNIVTGSRCRQGWTNPLYVVSAPLPPADPGSAPNYSPHSKPFDLVWDMNAGVDINGLPLDPIWAYQLPNVSNLPDFQRICGAAFSGGDTVNYNSLAAVCTSQQPLVDLSTSLFDTFGYCHAEPLKGHLNWALTTDLGTIFWEDFSGNVTLEDDDFNFGLYPPNKGALTDLGSGIGIEFNAGETIDNFHSPYWVSLRNAVENLAADLPGNRPDTEAHNLVDGKSAVVTGLFGIDAVHGGYTETHPVFSMAINIATQEGNGTVGESWAFFVRNTGDEGGCSHLEHDWIGLSGTDYYLQMPWPDGADDVSVVPGSSQVWANQQGSGTPLTFEKSPGWTYLKFRLPDPSVGASYDGQITFHYRLRPGLTPHRNLIAAAKRASSARAHAEEGGGWEEVQRRITDPTARQRFNQAIRASAFVHPVARPHNFRLAINPVIALHPRVAGPGNAGRLARPRDRIDARKKQANLALQQNLLKVISGAPTAQPPLQPH